MTPYCISTFDRQENMLNTLKIIRGYLPYLLALIMIAGSAVSFYYKLPTFAAANASTDMVSEWDEHMKPVREALPSDVLVAGYLEASNIVTQPVRYDDAEFFMTQYSLAPVALIKGMDHEWIIGNFGNTLSLADISTWLDQRIPHYEIQEFGFGIYLIHTISK